MAVDLQSGLHIFVPKPFADKQNVRTKLDQQTGVAVPLRYNNDKRKKP